MLKTKLLCSLIGIVFTLQASYAADTKEVVFSGGAPLNEYQPSIIIPILREAFGRHGIKFSAVYYPSLRSLLYSNSGRVDGELHRVYDFHSVSRGEYPNLVRIDSMLLSIWVTAFTKHNIKIKNWSDLKGHKVVYYLGRKNVEASLRKVLPSGMIRHTTTDEEAFKMLADGMADVVISESEQGNHIIANNPRYADIHEVTKLDETKIYAYIHKKHGYIAPKIAITIEAMKMDGSFSKIVEQANTVAQ